MQFYPIIAATLLAAIAAGQNTGLASESEILSSYFAVLSSAVSAASITSIDTSALFGTGGVPTDSGMASPTPAVTSATGSSGGYSSHGSANGGSTSASHGAAAPTGVIAGGTLAAAGVAALAILL